MNYRIIRSFDDNTRLFDILEKDDGKIYIEVMTGKNKKQVPLQDVEAQIRSFKDVSL